MNYLIVFVVLFVIAIAGAIWLWLGTPPAFAQVPDDAPKEGPAIVRVAPHKGGRWAAFWIEGQCSDRYRQMFAKACRDVRPRPRYIEGGRWLVSILQHGKYDGRHIAALTAELRMRGFVVTTAPEIDGATK